MLAVGVSTEPLVGGVQGMCHNRDLHPPLGRYKVLPLFWSVVDYICVYPLGSQILIELRLGLEAHSCNPSTQEAGAGELLEIQGQAKDN